MNIHEYSVACITSLESNKNSSAIAREASVSQSTASRFLQAVDFNAINFLDYLKPLFGRVNGKKLNFVGDETIVPRRYSAETEGTSSMIDHSTKTFTNGYRIVVGGLTDGKMFLPLDFEQWIAQFILGSCYRTMTEIMKVIISKLLELGIEIDTFIMDGSYFSRDFMTWLREKGLKFIIKAKTTTSVLFNGKMVKLKHCKELRLNRYQNAKTILAEWNGQLWHFTAVRQEGKRGSKIIYLIASFNAKPKIYAKTYNLRWTIEKFFRTAKQSLGLKDAMSQYAHIYLNHTKCVFLAYIMVQLYMKKYRLKSSEDAIRSIQDLKMRLNFSQIAQQFSLLENYA
jgi:hypothetical protein